ncbi:MAG: peptide chain release factor N(5)-glutamine methyltransferase [Nitrospirae bacterium]|nr:peptide chain release factor N(5)-glutamine methyltransferase [Nitrospirota bacterium]
MKALNILHDTAKTLKHHGVESAEKEAEILIRHCLDIDTTEIFRDNPEFTEEEAGSLKEMLQRRLGYEPLQYILGYEEFLGLNLIVGEGVLIPRPETELLAEEAIKTLRHQASGIKGFSSHVSLDVLDLCTGSGCIAISIAREFPRAFVCGVDISGEALRYAKTNAVINRVSNIAFLNGDVLKPMGELFTDACSPLSFDLIISNPPYIRRADIKNLQPEIKNWEPIIALDGGEDGLSIYRKLIPASVRLLKEGGTLMLEAGMGQAQDIAGIMESSGYSDVEIIKDYAKVERIIKAKKKACSG